MSLRTNPRRALSNLSGLQRKRALGAVLATVAFGAVAPAAQADFEIKPRHSPGKCLDVAAASQSNGARAIQWGCNGQFNQQFNLVASGDGLNIVPRHSKKCLDVAGANPSNGTKIQQWECLGVRNQQFGLRHAGVYGGIDYYNIITFAGKCVDIAAASTANGAVAQQWDCSGQANQQFSFTWR